MLRVGLTGGLASGKSFVGQALADLGCLWIQADALGREVMAPGGEAYEPVVAEFGRGILKEDGTIDRAKLSREVFSLPERLAVLNSLVHPPVVRREEKMMAEFAASEPDGIAVVEAAILIETGSHLRFDRLIVTQCDEATQIERALQREGATREEVVARLRRQIPVRDKVKSADYVIDTSGPKDETIRQIERIYEQLRSIES